MPEAKWIGGDFLALFTKALQSVDLRNSADGLRELLNHVNYLQQTLERQHTQDEKRFATLEKNLKMATKQNGGA